MARFIRVNHRELDAAANKIESDISARKSLATQATAQIAGMKAVWDGADYSAYLNQWNRIFDASAAYPQADKVLKSYAEYLRYASGQYKNAQASAINKANLIPTW